MSIEKRSWQDVMIETFGRKWIRDAYDIAEIGKLAERIIELEEENERIRDHSFKEMKKINDKGTIQMKTEKQYKELKEKISQGWKNESKLLDKVVELKEENKKLKEDYAIVSELLKEKELGES